MNDGIYGIIYDEIEIVCCAMSSRSMNDLSLAFYPIVNTTHDTCSVVSLTAKLLHANSNTFDIFTCGFYETDRRSFIDRYETKECLFKCNILVYNLKPTSSHTELIYFVYVTCCI